MIVLKSGCVCCTIRTDLVSTLMQLLAIRGRKAPFERIVIETSGVSDPVPILQTVRSDPKLLTRFRVASVLCTLDATQAADVLGTSEGVAQATAADGVAVTKTDIASPADTARANAAFTSLNPIADLVPTDSRGLVDWLIRRETKPDDSARLLHLAGAAAGEHSHNDFQSTVLRAVAPISWPHFALWLTRLVFLHGDRILRTKGLLFDRERGLWIGVHGVRRFFYPPTHLELSSAPDCGACLVFVTEGIDGARLERSYRRWVEDEHSKEDWATRSLDAKLGRRSTAQQEGART